MSGFPWMLSILLEGIHKLLFLYPGFFVLDGLRRLWILCKYSSNICILCKYSSNISIGLHFTDTHTALKHTIAECQTLCKLSVHKGVNLSTTFLWEYKWNKVLDVRGNISSSVFITHTFVVKHSMSCRTGENYDLLFTKAEILHHSHDPTVRHRKSLPTSS